MWSCVKTRVKRFLVLENLCRKRGRKNARKSPQKAREKSPPKTHQKAREKARDNGLPSIDSLRLARANTAILVIASVNDF